METAIPTKQSSRAKEPDAPILMDVHITAMSPQAFTLTGFERIDGTEYVQSWLVTERGLP